jgi:hypothetical protein
MRPQQYFPVAIFTALFLFHASGATLYVSLNSTNPVPPYAGWNTAATNIQDAVDASTNSDLIQVTNGFYQTAGRIGPDGARSCIVVTNAVELQSAGGAGLAVIGGNVNMRCVFLTNGATLLGFTLTNGNQPMGGGVFCATTNESVFNCQIVKNAAGKGGGAYGGTIIACTLLGNAASEGGGAARCTLFNCIVTNNQVTGGLGLGSGVYFCTSYNCTLSGNTYPGPISGLTTSGGGAYNSTLNFCVISGNNSTTGGGMQYGTANNCTFSGNTSTFGGGEYQGTLNNCLLIGNSASTGGGAYEGSLNNCTIIGNNDVNESGGADVCTLVNCIVVNNSSYAGQPNYDNSSGLNFCCATPLPPGTSNIANDPHFVNSSTGNFRLQTNSPCINAGNYPSAVGTTDLDGRPRIVGGTVDIGAYEFQAPGMGEFIAWLQQNGLATDGSVDNADLDGTGLTVYQDWIAGLNPTNPLSVLAMLPPVKTNSPAGLFVTWQSVTNRSYFLQCSTNLVAHPTFTTIRTNVLGLVGTTSYTDTNAVGPGPYFYRVGVK